MLADGRKRSAVLSGLQGSAAAMTFAAADVQAPLAVTLLFVLDDQDEAGYFYHDLVQLMGDERVLFFPSSFRRAVKFGQRDAANEILRTEVLSRLAQRESFIVTYPEALAERVVSKQKLDERTLEIRVGEQVDIPFVEQTLLAFGFNRTDYVYEPGQFAVRGSLVDVYSFSHELPFRIDFFGDEVDSIRTFEVDSQLSRGKRDAITLVPELSGESSGLIPVAELLPEDTVIVSNDLTFVTQRIGQIWEEGFSRQAEISLSTSQSQIGAPSLPPRGGASVSACVPEDMDAPPRGGWEGAVTRLMVLQASNRWLMTVGEARSSFIAS